MPGTIRLIDSQGEIRDVPVDAASGAIESGWRVPTDQEQVSRVAGQAREEMYGGVGGGIKASLAAGLRGATVGLSDVAARAVGGDDAAITLEGLRNENPGLSTGFGIAGAIAPALISGGASLAAGIGEGVAGVGARAAALGAEGIGAGLGRAGAGIAELGAEGSLLGRLGSSALGRAAELVPSSLVGSAGRGISAAVGGGLRGALAAGATEGALYGAGEGVSELALSDDPLTIEHAAAALGSNALFGAATGAALGAAGNGLERALRRGKGAIDAALEKQALSKAKTPIEAIETGDLQHVDKRILDTAEKAEIERIRAEQAPQREAFTDELDTWRRANRDEHDLREVAKSSGNPDISEAGGAFDRANFELRRALDNKIKFTNEPLKSLDAVQRQAQALEEMRAATLAHEQAWRAEVDAAPAQIRSALDEVEALGAPDGVPATGTTKDVTQSFDVGGRTLTLTTETKPLVPGSSPRTKVTVTRTLGDGEEVVAATAEFSHRASGLYPEHVNVEPALQRQGVATRMYDAVEAATGKRAIPSDSQTPQGKAFRAARDVSSGGFDLKASTEGGPVFNPNPKIENGIPKFKDISRDTYKDVAYVASPSDLAKIKRLRGISSGDMAADARTARFREAWARGEKVPPIEIDVSKDGHYFVADGNHRLMAAAADGDRAVVVRFRPVDADLSRMDAIAGDLKAAIQVRPTGPSAADMLTARARLARKLGLGEEAGPFTSEGKDAAAERVLMSRKEFQWNGAVKGGLKEPPIVSRIPRIDEMIEANRRLQSQLEALAKPPTSDLLTKIGEARAVLEGPKPAQGGLGAVVGAVAPFAGPVGAAAAAGGRVIGSLRKAIGEATTRVGKATSSFLGAAATATGAARPYAPLVATKVLAGLRYGNERRDTEPSTLPDLYKARTDEIKQLTAYDETGTPRMRPDARVRLGKQLQPIAVANPIMADRIETQKVRGIEYLSSIIPRRPDVAGVPVGPDKWQPSDMAMRSWARSAAAVEDPYGVLERASHGAVTPEDAAAMHNVHREMLDDFARNVMSQLPTLRQSLPYDRQLALSILTGKPVTAALDPKVLSVLQDQFPEEPGSAAGTQAPKAQPQFGSISKSISQPTPAQSRAQGAHV